MRKILLISLATVLLLVAFTPACKAGQTVTLGQEVQLQPGQQVSISGESLTIEFVKVNEDSRCPTGVM
jgi:hypothetical protein